MKKNPRLCFNIQPNQFLCYRQGWWNQEGGGGQCPPTQILADEVILFQGGQLMPTTLQGISSQTVISNLALLC